MIITISPVRMDATLAVSRAGSVLTLNGDPVDLASYDAVTDPNPWIVGQPVLADGLWRVTLILPHGADAPDEVRFPAPITLTGDGPVALPTDAADPQEA